MKPTIRMARPRAGATFLELTLACALLGATLLSVSTFRQSTLSHSQSGQRASFAQSRVINLRREISTWSLDKVSVATIENIPADETGYLPGARWTASVKDIEEPIVGKRVMLALRWREGPIDRRCPGLTFWMERR